MNDELFTLACVVGRRRSKSIQVYDYATQRHYWLPRSHIREITVDRFQSGTVVMTKWIAQQKGFTK